MYDGPLGTRIGPNEDITISVWAPTAQQVLRPLQTALMPSDASRAVYSC